MHLYGSTYLKWNESLPFSNPKARLVLLQDRRRLHGVDVRFRWIPMLAWPATFEQTGVCSLQTVTIFLSFFLSFAIFFVIIMFMMMTF